jgi:hypothetical protein
MDVIFTLMSLICSKTTDSISQSSLPEKNQIISLIPQTALPPSGNSKPNHRIEASNLTDSSIRKTKKSI